MSCSRATREMSSIEPSLGRPSGRRLPGAAGREVADQPQPGLRVGRNPARDHLRRRGRADDDAGGNPGQPVPGEAQHGAQREAADQGAEADQDRAPGRERPDRAQRQQAVQGERPEGAGRDQGRQLVEGAVPDPPVVVVVEAVKLQDQDPDRAEEDRPEERRDVRGRGRRGGEAEGADQGDPVAGGEQAAQQGPALARAGRPGEAEAGRGIVAPRRRLGGLRGRLRPSGRGVLCVPGHLVVTRNSFARGFSFRARSRSSCAAASSPPAYSALERR